LLLVCSQGQRFTTEYADVVVGYLTMNKKDGENRKFQKIRGGSI
jgi:hypothetical protein